MRITAELLQQGAEQRTNPLQERELVLRGYGILELENLGAMATAPAAVTNGGSVDNHDSKDGHYDALDLSNNRLTELGNFPRLPRLSSLYVSHNQIGATTTTTTTTTTKNSSSSLLSPPSSSCIAVTNLQRNLRHLTTLTLCFNRIHSLATIAQIAQACPNLTFLSLRGNPVTHKPQYRLFTIHQFDYERQQQQQLQQNSKQQPSKAAKQPSKSSSSNPLLSSPSSSNPPLVLLRILDYSRIRPAERKQAHKWSISTTGATILSQVAAAVGRGDHADHETTSSTSKTFVPGESLPNDNDNDHDNKDENESSRGDATIVKSLSDEQKAILRQLLQNATSEAEIQTIQRAILQQGMAPETYLERQQQLQQQLQQPSLAGIKRKETVEPLSEENPATKRSRADHHDEVGGP
ncbi:hypothetical protein ACA910_001436 [Epithemia clementina (nom. ined.)]